MRRTWIQMGMPVSVILADAEATVEDVAAVYGWFAEVDALFSTYRPDSQISLLNAGRLGEAELDSRVSRILEWSQQTTVDTNGYFSIQTKQGLDPSGLVKGWAINAAVRLLEQRGRRNFVVDAGGDVAVMGVSESGQPWRVGIRHPWQHEQWVKVVSVKNKAVATSGTSARGRHIVNPHTGQPPEGIVSLTMVGPDIYEADRMATAAFAMGRAGLEWLENRPNLEGYMIDDRGVGHWTKGFAAYVVA